MATVQNRPRGPDIKLTVHEFVTLDGVTQGPGAPEEDTSGGFDRGGWVVPFVDEDFGRIVDGWFRSTTELLYGRTTYQLMAGYWPQVTDPDDHVAAALNTSPKHVVSTTLTDPQWSNTVGVISEDVVAAVRALKERPGDELQVHGCWQLVQTLHNAGLVDEYRLLEFPVVVGGGKRVFHDGAAASNFTVVHSETTGSGAVYRVLQPVPFQAGTVAVEDGKDVAGVHV